MENNITSLFKAITFMNKKTVIPAYDDYILIENGNFILQDAYKTYILHFDVFKNVGNFVFNKADLIKIKTKNAKYFIEDISNDVMCVKIITKDSEKIESIPLIRRYLNHLSLVERDFTCSNSINTNGISLKSILNGYKDDITFKFIDGEVHVAMGADSPYVHFNNEFGELCTLSVESHDNSIAQTVGQNISDTIGQFGLVKKNSDLNIKFNENCFVLSNTNLTIYISSNKI